MDDLGRASNHYPLRPWIAQPRRIGELDDAHGVQVRHAPLETPEAIGRVERHGGVLKGMARKVVAQTQAVGWVDLQSVVDECCAAKNHLLRT